MPTLRNHLIRLAYERPELRPDLLPLVASEGRKYEDYVEEFEGKDSNKGKKPLEKKQWEARGKGEERLEGRKLDTKVLRKNMPDSFDDSAWEDLTGRLTDMSDEDFDKAAKKLKALSEDDDADPKQLMDWGTEFMGGGETEGWLKEMDEKDGDDEIGLFGNALMSMFEKLYKKVRDL